MSCCTSGLSDVFDEDFARRDAARYRKRGLPPRARKLLDALESVTPLEGRTTIEAGVGAGAVTVDMLRRGATHAIGVDAVPAQIASTRSLANEFHVAERTELIVGDFAHVDAAKADVVILDRVVCCYPEWQPLLQSACDHAVAAIALTYPRENAVLRLVHHLMDIWFFISRSEFRFHVHPVHEMHAFLEHAGFILKKRGSYFWWEILVAERSA